jgi:hypothetical protein
MYVHDFFNDGSVEQIVTLFRNGVSYPLAGRDELVRVMPQLGSKYPTYASFGASRIDDILPSGEVKKAQVREADTFASPVALNTGKGGFKLQPLPVEAQFAPVEAVVARDFDGDRKVDLLVAGNFYGVTPVRGRYDASYGLLLRGDGSGRFVSVEMEKSGVAIGGQVRKMASLRRANGDSVIVAARNDDKLQILGPRSRRAQSVQPLTKRTP